MLKSCVFLFFGILFLFSACGQSGSEVSQTKLVDLSKYTNISLEIYKEKRLLVVKSQQKPIKYFSVGLGFAPTGDKVQEGDGKTPEGSFYVCQKVPNSNYHKAFLISYPSPTHAKAGFERKSISEKQYQNILYAHKVKGIPPQNTALGGLIEIHGNGSSSDWTLGCIALEDTCIDELWKVVTVGTLVTIYP